MTEHRIATLAMKIFGLFIIFRGLSLVLQFAEFLLRARTLEFFVGSGVTSAAIMLVLGVLVWHRAEALASRALPEREREEHTHDAGPSGLTTHSILVVAFVILGIYLLVTAVSHATTAAGFWYEASSIEEASPIEDPDQPLQFVQDTRATYQEQARLESYRAAGFGVGGLILLLGARGLGTFFTRSWWMGGPETEPSDDVIEVEVDEPFDDR